MKEASFEAITILLILLPGFFCARLVQYLCVREDRKEFDKIVEALLYSFLVYVICASLHVSPPISLNVESNGDITTYSFQPRTWSLLSLAVVAGGLAFLIGAMETNDFPARWLRKMRFTQRTARSSTWSDVFHEFGGYVQVELEDERSVLGWVRLYADKPDEHSLFLEDASWVDKENNVTPIDGPGIYLTKESRIRSIMFLRAEENAEPKG